MNNKEWLSKSDHVFILSAAGKPIYCLHGEEDKLATIVGVMQAIVSFVQDNDNNIISIHANGLQIVFLIKTYIVLVAVSKSSLSVEHLQLQLL